MVKSKKSDVFNAGLGKGYSNLEVIKTIEKETGLKVEVVLGPKRSGDANELFASNLKIKKALGWEPKYDLSDIVKTAFLWHKNHPNGYSSWLPIIQC